MSQYRCQCFNGVGLARRVSQVRAGFRRCCWLSHTGIHGIHLAGGCSAPGLGVPLGLTVAAGGYQERVGVVMAGSCRVT